MAARLPASNRALASNRAAVSAYPRLIVGGSLLANTNFDQYPTLTAPTGTGSRFIDGTAGGSTTNSTYRWATELITNNALASFDPTVFRTSAASLKLSTVQTNGVVRCGLVPQSVGTVSAANLRFLIPVDPSTSYTMTAWVKTDNVFTNGAFIRVVEVNAAGTVTVSSDSNKLAGTNDWTQITRVVTTDAATRFVDLSPRCDQAGNISHAWFDEVIFRKTVPPTRNLI